MNVDLHLDRKLTAYWDNQQGIMACYGGPRAKGFPSSMLQIIANAADRGAVHAR